MNGSTRTLVVFALTAALTLTGCVDSISDGDSGLLGSQSTEAEENLAIHLTAENVPEDAGHLGLVFKDVYVHDAANTSDQGYFPLNLKTTHADLVTTDGTSSVEAASGDVPAGTYDQVRLQLRDLDAGGSTSAEASGNTSGDGHAHDHGGDGHAHDDSSGEANAEIPTDIPINLTFEVTEGDLTEVDLVIDVGASLEGGSFDPVLTRAEVTVGGETSTVDDVEILTQEEAGQISEDAPDTAPPVARIAVFGPNGNQDYESDFQAESGDYANTKANPYPPNADVRFSASDSEAVETGATLETYEWDFDDGNTETGATVSHAFDGPGGYEVTATVTDSNGVQDSQTVVVIVLGWNQMLLEESFEEDESDWTTERGTTSLAAWQKVDTGYESNSSWHVGTDLIVQHDEGAYPPFAEATLLSPEYEIPSDWNQAGFTFRATGGSEAGFDQLNVTILVDGEEEPLTLLDGNADAWKEVGDLEVLNNQTGQTIQFKFHFTADFFTESGDGWFVDHLQIGGVDVELHKPALLEQDDGHDHEH